MTRETTITTSRSDDEPPSWDGYQEFETLAASAVRRMYELRASDAALFRLIATYAQFKLQEASGTLPNASGWGEVRNGFSKIKPETVEILDKEYSSNTVVAALTLFDTFLSDLTRFLFLLRPGALPKDRQIKVGNIVTAGSLPEVLDTIVGKYVHELSYANLTDRIKHLETKFGITCLGSGGVFEELEKYVEVRNLIIHDAASFRYRASRRSGYIHVSMRSDRPKVAWEDAENAVKSCLLAVDELFTATSRTVFGREPTIRLVETPHDQPAA